VVGSRSSPISVVDRAGVPQLRDAGPAVGCPSTRCSPSPGTTRFGVRWENGESFVSRNGVMMNDRMNQVLRGNTLCSDGAEHDLCAMCSAVR